MNAMHYVISVAEKYGLNIGATLLCKIIFFAELWYLDKYGEMLTNVKMVKATYGPVPDGHSPALTKLAEQNKISITRTPQQICYKSLKNPDTTDFTEQQLKTLDMISIVISTNYSAKMITEMSHANRYWQLADMGEEIPLVGFISGKQRELTSDELDKIDYTYSNLGIPENWEASYE
jgi:uncharacterized phage-associated protein